MHTITDKYRFEIQIPFAGFEECFPKNSELAFEWKRENGQIFYRKRLATDLVFANYTPPTKSAEWKGFDKLWQVENSGNRCTAMTFLAFKDCEDSESLFWQGRVHLIDGTFNPCKCLITIRPRVYDEYTCLLDNDEVEYNILEEIQESVETRALLGEVECTTCRKLIESTSIDPLKPPLDDCINSGEGWTLRNHEVYLDDPTRSEFQIITTWCREVYNSTVSPGSGWIDIGGGQWARPLQSRQTVFIDEPTEYTDRYEFVFDDDTIYDNGRYLADVLQFFASICGYNVCSNFFSINPDNTYPNNTAYSKAILELSELVIYQITDIANPDAEENATKATLTFKRLMENLRVMFNVYWIVENNCLKLEHVSYFKEDVTVLNLRQDGISKFTDGIDEYSYNQAKLPSIEKFLWKFTTGGENEVNEFDGVPIEYLSGCFREENKTNTYTATEFVTNLGAVSKNEEYDSTDGLFMLATEGGAVIADYGDLRPNEYFLNQPLSWAGLQDCYLKWDRPQNEGKMNEEIQDFISNLRTKQQKGLKFPMCCDDVINNFDPQDLVFSQLGYGEIETARYTEPSGIMELDLNID